MATTGWQVLFADDVDVNSCFASGNSEDAAGGQHASSLMMFGDETQVGGSRVVYEGPVDQRQYNLIIGDHAQVGGIRNIGK